MVGAQETPLNRFRAAWAKTGLIEKNSRDIRETSLRVPRASQSRHRRCLRAADAGR